MPYQTNCGDNDSWDSHQKCLSQRNFPFKKRKFYDAECQSFSDKETNVNGKDNICLSRKILKEDSSG